jgi:DNA-binding MarR family transcriptional regulator
MTKRDVLGADGEFSRETSLGYAVNFVGRAFAFALERRLARHGVALGQFPLLLTLWEKDGLTQSEIARRLLIEQPTVANTLKRMERDGLIATAADPNNRRLVRISLTAKGRALENALIAEAQAVNKAAVAGLTRRDAALFLDLARRMARNLADEAPGSERPAE